MRLAVPLTLGLTAGCAPAALTTALDIPAEAHAMLLVSGVPPEVAIHAYDLPVSASIPFSVPVDNTGLAYVGYYRASLADLQISPGPVPVVEDGRPLPTALMIQAVTPDLRPANAPRNEWPEILRSVEIAGCAGPCDCAPQIAVIKAIALGEPPTDPMNAPNARFILPLDERRALVHLVGPQFFVVDEDRAERIEIDTKGAGAFGAIRRDDGSLWLSLRGGTMLQLDPSLTITSSSPSTLGDIWPRSIDGARSGPQEIFAVDDDQRFLRWREDSGWEDLHWEAVREQAPLRPECGATTQVSDVLWQGYGRAQALYGEGRIWHYDERAAPPLSPETLSPWVACRAIVARTPRYGPLLAVSLMDPIQPVTRSYSVYRWSETRWVEWFFLAKEVRALLEVEGYLIMSLESGDLALVAPGSDGDTPEVCSEVRARDTNSTQLTRVADRVLVGGAANCDDERCAPTPPDVVWIELR